MGKVVCEQHGANVGTLCCDHVREGTQKRSSFETPTAIRVDWLEDGSESCDALICDECAQRFGLFASRQVSGDQVEDPDYLGSVRHARDALPSGRYPLCRKACSAEHSINDRFSATNLADRRSAVGRQRYDRGDGSGAARGHDLRFATVVFEAGWHQLHVPYSDARHTSSSHVPTALRAVG